MSVRDGEPIRQARPASSTTQSSASPSAAAVLSFLVPGLGQIALGAFRRGFLLALPILVTAAVVAIAAIADRRDLIGAIFRPEVILALVVLDVVLGLLHLVAIGDAYRLARRRRVRSAWSVGGGFSALLTVLFAATLIIHGAIGVVGVQAYDTLNAVFQAPTSKYKIPTPSFVPTADSSASPDATTGPTAFNGPAWAADGRLNVLLIGGDAGPGRWNLRTDTMIVLSVDVASGAVAMFGIPRNIINVPLAPEDSGIFPGNRYPDLLNSLWVYADTHRSLFPGGDSAGFRAITGAVQQLVGVPLDGALVVKLNGFVDLVNALGGVWVNVTSPIYDNSYPLEDGSGYVTLNIKVGCQHMSGHLALAYARSRHASDDYNRMGRQQIVLKDLAQQLDPLALITQSPKLLDIAGQNLKTTFSPADVPDLAQLAARVDKSGIEDILFDPPTYPEYVTTSEVKAIQKVVRNVFKTSSVGPGSSVASPFPTLHPTVTPKPAKACPPSK